MAGVKIEIEDEQLESGAVARSWRLAQFSEFSHFFERRKPGGDFLLDAAQNIQGPSPRNPPRLRAQPCYFDRGMSTPERQKINLRRPDVMEAVQAQVLSHYRSDLVNRIRDKGHVLSADGLLTIKLAKKFGFCYGVERAIDLAYAARRVFPPPKPIYLLGEIIHNPEVNDQIRNMGIQIISPKPTRGGTGAAARRATSSSSPPSAPKWTPNRSWSPKAANWWTPPAAT